VAIVTPYETRQRQRTLTIVIWMILIASLLLMLFNLQFDSVLSILSLIALSLLCILALVMNQRGHYVTAAVLLSIMVVLALTISIFEGDGLFDPGVVAFPIFIILATMLLGSRSVLGITFAAVILLLVVAYFQSQGQINVTVRANDISMIIPLMIFIAAAGLMVWVITSNLENNMAQLHQSETALRQSYELTLAGWAKALEYRDRETEGHSQRVVCLSRKLAEKLGCSEDKIRQIEHGALLHDIGKMGISDKILLKSGPLDPDEWEMMRMHPDLGREMLTGIHFLRPALEVVYYHHERWDGRGYPQGLRGEQIPLAARIFSVIDNWDALTSDRPYRPAWPEEEVYKFLRRNAGKMFDPLVVNTFLGMDKSC